MSRVLLLDTNVWAHLVISDEPKRRKVQEQLAALVARYPGATRATSAICVAEALVGARREADAARAQAVEERYRKEFAPDKVIIVPVNESVLDTAATLRAEALRSAEARKGAQPVAADGGKLSLPDAIVAASCLWFDPPAVLVTENIGDFKEFSVKGVFVGCVGGLTVESV